MYRNYIAALKIFYSKAWSELKKVLKDMVKVAAESTANLFLLLIGVAASTAIISIAAVAPLLVAIAIVYHTSKAKKQAEAENG